MLEIPINSAAHDLVLIIQKLFVDIRG